MRVNSSARLSNTQGDCSIPEFARGLLSKHKFIPSHYFYDSVGSDLFTRITELPEYYLTKVELDILRVSAKNIADAMKSTQKVVVAELGIGDARKISILVGELVRRGISLTCIPIDVSQSALTSACSELMTEFPHISVNPVCGNYESGLSYLAGMESEQRLVMFLGSSIGNLTSSELDVFLRNFRKSLRRGDMGLIGFDLLKDPEILIPAYSDSLGVTKAFNLNLLKRLNHDLCGDINLDCFTHYAMFQPQSNSMESYLLSLCDQTLHFKQPSFSVNLHRFEAIHTESSHKYTVDQILQSLKRNGLCATEIFYDECHWFADVMVRMVE